MRHYCIVRSIVLVGWIILGGIVLAAGAAQGGFTSTAAVKDGLEVTVIGEKATFAMNEPIKFSVRFKNVSDKPLSLLDADEFDQWIVRLEETGTKMPWRLTGLPSVEPDPAHHARELKPGESIEVSTDWGSNRFSFHYESELILNMPIPPTDSLRAGRYRLWLGINLKKNPDRGGAHTAFRGDINIGPIEIEISDKDDPAGIQTSEAVTEKIADFQTVTRARWVIPAAGAKSEVQIGMRVTNRTNTWMQINVFDTVEVVLEDSQGMKLRGLKSRDGTHVPEPLIFQPRESRTIYRNATLEWSPDGKTLRLTGPDGAGGMWQFDDLKPGKSTVQLICQNDEQKTKSALDGPAKHVIGANEAPFWMGNVTTKGLPVEIVGAPSAKP
jgi:hypothetical protein